MVSFYITQDTQRHPLLPELFSGDPYFDFHFSLISYAWVIRLEKDSVLWEWEVTAVMLCLFEPSLLNILNKVEFFMSRWIPYLRQNCYTVFHVRSSKWWANSWRICSSHKLDRHTHTPYWINSRWRKDRVWELFDSDYTGMHVYIFIWFSFLWFHFISSILF